MKAQINQSILSNAIESAMLAISTKPATPVVGCIIIEANNEQDNLIIKSTNTAFSIYQIIDAELSKPGSVAIPAKILKDTIASFTGELSLEFDGDYLAIAHETGQCRLMTNGNIDEFPDVEDATDDERYCTITISTKKLEAAMNSVLYAACTDETKMILTGVNFDITNDELVATTTDGHRVARTSNTLDGTNIGCFNFTIPAKTLTEVSKILQKAPENSNCVFNIYDNIVVITMPGIKVVSRLLAGEYPAIEKLIPNNFKSEFTLERKAFQARLKRVLNLADKKDRSLTIWWDISNCTATLTTESSDFGDACDSISMKPQTTVNENFQIGFNIDYLANAVNSITTDEVVIKCNDSPQPVIIRPIGGLLDQLGLVMPLQIRSSRKAASLNKVDNTSRPNSKEDVTNATEVTEITNTTHKTKITDGTNVTDTTNVNEVTKVTDGVNTTDVTKISETTEAIPQTTSSKTRRSKKTASYA